jgi:threonine dehydratase
MPGLPPTLPVSLAEVYQARRRIAGKVLRTPLIASRDLSRRAGGSVYLKLEGLQKTGSFKTRGAFNKILTLSREESRRGVITFSTGNHGRAVACAAGEAGIPAVVCVSEHVPSYRVQAIASYGAEVVVRGRSQDQAEEYYRQLQKDRELVPVNPFDDPRIIAGQATIGLEIMEDLPQVDTVMIPLSGGGLLSGIALALKSANPSIRVVAVSIERSPVMQESVKAGKAVAVEERDTLADSLLGGIGQDNRYTLSMGGELTDEFIAVTEQEIASGMTYALREHGLVVEGAGAVGVGALLAGKIGNPGGCTAVVLSGSSVDLPRYLEVVSRHSAGAGNEVEPWK